jgi:hypothetical protein
MEKVELELKPGNQANKDVGNKGKVTIKSFGKDESINQPLLKQKQSQSDKKVKTIATK